MYKIDFNEPIHIHFIGIGGISMSGLAEILLKEGFTVSGSDTKESPLTKKLVSEGAHIIYGQKVENITRDIGCVVYTAAINRNNPELIEAVALKIPMLTRAELLGQLMKNYDTPIAVSGTHGKTTTTSMISHILLEGDLDPTISVGGILKAIGGNIRVGNSGTFITEACEYTNSFLHFFPKISVILNIEEDHLDFFKDLEDIRHSFHQFAELLPEDGTLIINAEIKDYAEIYEGLSCNVVTYGTNGCFDYSAKNITYDENGHVAFDLFRRGEYADHIQLSVTGDHNVSNALSAIAVADILGLSIDITKRGLLSFTGTDRRFEYKGEFNGVTVIDDYAHHPTEILAIAETANKTDTDLKATANTVDIPEKQRSTLCTTVCGVYSNLILIQGQKRSSMNSQRRSLMQTTSYLPISLLQEKQILSASPRQIWRKKPKNSEQIRTTSQALHRSKHS